MTLQADLSCIPYTVACDLMVAGRACKARLVIAMARSPEDAQRQARAKGWDFPEPAAGTVMTALEFAIAVCPSCRIEKAKRTESDAAKAAAALLHCPKCGKTPEQACAFAAASCGRPQGHGGIFAQEATLPLPARVLTPGEVIQAERDLVYADMVGRRHDPITPETAQDVHPVGSVVIVEGFTVDNRGSYENFIDPVSADRHTRPPFTDHRRIKL